MSNSREGVHSLEKPQKDESTEDKLPMENAVKATNNERVKWRISAAGALVVVFLGLLLQQVVLRLYATPPGAQEAPTNGSPASVGAVSTLPGDRFGLFELVIPPKESHTLDVVFVHGLGGSWNDTWITSTGVLWPKEWLAFDVPNARILSYGYPNDKAFWDEHAGRMSLADRADNFFLQLKWRDVGQTRPAIFLGHSMGGLVIKQLITRLHRSDVDDHLRKRMLANVRGVVFYGTPHLGGNPTAWYNVLTYFGSESVKILEPFSKDLIYLNDEFLKLNIRTLSFAESRPFNGVIVVPKASASIGVPEHKCYVIDADHVEICKPTNTDGVLYLESVDFIRNSMTQVPLALKSRHASPSVPQTFIGRATEIAFLRTSMLPSASSLASVRIVVVGTRGIGKSSLLQQAISLNSEQFRHRWFIDGAGLESVLDGLMRVASDLALSDANHANVAERVRTALSDGNDSRWLLHVDNVSSKELARGLVTLLPKRGGCVVVTSRNDSIWSADFKLLKLDRLSSAEAVQVLQSDDPVAAKLAELVGGLPLALVQARAYVLRRGITWDEYYNWLKMQSVTPPNSAITKLESHEITLLPTLQLSVRGALLENPACTTMLQLIQVLHPESIPKAKLLEAAFLKADGHGFGFDTDPSSCFAIIQDYSLATVTADAVSTYRLMQDVMKSESPHNVSTLVALSEVLYDIVFQSPHTGIGLARSLRPHFEELLLVMAAEIPETLAYAQSLYGLSTVLARGFRDDNRAIPLLTQSLAIYERLYGVDHMALAKPMKSLGLLYGNVDDWIKEKDLLARALVLEERQYGSDNIAVADTMAVLGRAYVAVGDIMEGKSLIEQALSIQERHYGADDVNVAHTLGLLGNAHADSGDYMMSKTLLERSLSIFEKHYGSDDVHLASTLVNLAVAYNALGYSLTAKAHALRALNMEEHHYGSSDVEVAKTVLVLADTCIKTGDVLAARQHIERALLIYERTFGVDDERTRKVRNHLSSIRRLRI